MANLPNIPSIGGNNQAADLATAAAALKDQLDQVRTQMATAAAGEMPKLIAQLKLIAQSAAAAGPQLAQLGSSVQQGSNQAAQKLRAEFQGIIDNAAALATPKASSNDSGGSISAVATQASGVADALGILRGNLIALDIGGLIGKAKPFVEALSPATVQVFNFAMCDLSATIGSAVVPAFQVMIGVVRDAAGLIAPAMRALAPVIQQLAQVFGGVLLSAVQSVVVVLQDLLPLAGLGAMFELLQLALNPTVVFFELLSAVLEPFGDIISTATSLLADAFTALQVVLRAIGETIGQLINSAFGGSHKTVMDQMTIAVHQVITGLVLLTAYLASIAGLKGVREAISKGIESQINGPAGAGNVAAPQGAHVTGLEQITKDLAVAASTAGAGGGKAKTDTEWLSELDSKLKKISDVDFEKMIRDAIQQGIQNAWETIKSQVVPSVDHAGAGIASTPAGAGAVSGAVSAGGGLIGGLISGAAAGRAALGF